MPITQTIDPISPVPDIADPATFETRANTLLTVKLPTLASQINALITQFNALASEVQADADTWAGAVGAANKWYPLASSSDPTQRPDGTPVQEGDIYFNSTISAFKARFAGVWQVVNLNAAALASGSGASMVGYQNSGVGGLTRTVLSKLLEVISVKEFGAIGDGNSHPLSTVYATLAAAQVVYPHATSLTDEIDWCAFQKAANYAVGLANGCAIMVPAGKYRCKKITYDALANAGGKPLWVGDGSGYSRIVHVDGASEPLFYVTGAATGLSAYPWGGWSGLRFEAGTLTTDLIKFDGAIDNQTVFEDLQFNGTNGTTGALCNGLNIRDFLNLRISRVRWDAMAGWGIYVRECLSAFGRTSMSIREFSYDNQQVGPRGRGFINCDATAAGDGRVSLIDLDDGTIELNAALEGATPERCLIKFENSLASAGFILPQGRVSLNSVQFQGNVSVGRNFRCLGNTWGELAIICENVTVLNFKQFYDNDQGNAAGAVQGNIPNLLFIPQMSSGELNGGDSTRNQLVDRFAGVGVGAVRDDTKLTTSSYFRRGDWAQFVNPNQAAIGRPFAYKAVQEQAGICAAFDTGTIGTAAITSGTPTLVFSATIPDRCLPGFAVEVIGAGVAGASLFAKVLTANTDTNTVTLDTNASTTVAAAGVKVARAQVMAVDMVFYGTAAPTTGTYKQGDKVVNTAPAAGGFIGWVCVAGGTPGTWKTYGAISP